MSVADREIVREFLRAQRSVRALQKANPGPASIAAAHLLVYLNRNAIANAGELAEHLNLPASKVTRILKQLSEKKAVSVKPALRDRRERQVTITRAGERMLSELDSAANTNTGSWFSKLNVRQQRTFEGFLASLADALGAPHEDARETEISIRREQRRIARSGGLYAGVLMNSKFNLLEYHILLEVIAADAPIKMEKLFNLPFDRASISRASDGLKRSGILRKVVDKDDRRCMLTSLTKKGEREFLKAEDALLDVFKRALKPFKSSDKQMIRESQQKIIATTL